MVSAPSIRQSVVLFRSDSAYAFPISAGVVYDVETFRSAALIRSAGVFAPLKKHRLLTGHFLWKINAITIFYRATPACNRAVRMHNYME